MTDVPGVVLTEADVAAYLFEHPDFFQRHLELLEHLHIPHPSGNAVSLISKQLEIFRTKHQEQESQLSALIEIARENDAAFNRMHELTLAMLEADCLEDLVANLNQVLSDCFLTDFVALKIIRSVDRTPLANLFIDPECAELTLFRHELTTNQPKCGRPTLPQARFLFGDAAIDVKSCAIIPMTFVQLEALLAIGSREEGRFHYSMGSLFLTQMSEIIGTRLISILRREDAV